MSIEPLDGFEYTPDGFNPRQWLKGYAKSVGMTMKDLLAMSGSNDPFYRGTTGRGGTGFTDFERAYWFKHLYDKYGRAGIHVRGLHYKIVHAPIPERMLDGSPYENTESCWKELQQASVIARVLRIVNAREFSDSRNTGEVVSVGDFELTETGQDYTIETPDYSNALPEAPFFFPPEPSGYVHYDPMRFGVGGYEYNDKVHQPWIIEIWSEKSGDDSALRHLARVHNANYIPAKGFNSLTAVTKALRRRETLGLPKLFRRPKGRPRSI